MKVELFQKQQQQLKVTPQLRQSIEMLQYPILDLVNYVKEQINENPLVEVDIKEEYMPQDYRKAQNADFSIESIGKKDTSLRAHLFSQVGELKLSKAEDKNLRFLIDCLDERGILSEPVSDLAASMSCDEQHIKHCISILQSFDPLGVGATNIQECLLLQLKSRNPRHHIAEEIVSNYLNELSTLNIDAIATQLSVVPEKVSHAIDVIKSLNPFPASSFSPDSPQYITPDVIIEQLQDELKVRINDHLLPTFKLNNEYVQASFHQDDDTSSYIAQKVQHYHWLKNSIEQRQQTLSAVMIQIVAFQRNFFQSGHLFLQPMTLKEVAHKIDVHESTVSRAVKDKYIQTGQGVFPLKTLFSSKVKTTRGNSVSSSIVKYKISELVLNENKAKPLSDQNIVALLREEGIEVSRRTIAKYRLQLQIPSSSIRRRTGSTRSEER